MPVAPIGAAAPPAAPTAVSQRPAFKAALDARAPSGAPREASPTHPLAAALGGVERAQQRLDAVLAAARAGRTFTAGELLGLQAQAYRYAQTVDLASKIVEQGAQSVKQAANTQV